MKQAAVAWTGWVGQRAGKAASLGAACTYMRARVYLEQPLAALGKLHLHIPLLMIPVSTSCLLGWLCLHIGSPGRDLHVSPSSWPPPPPGAISKGRQHTSRGPSRAQPQDSTVSFVSLPSSEHLLQEWRFLSSPE